MSEQKSAVTALKDATDALESRGRALAAVVTVPGAVAEAEAVHRDALRTAGVVVGPLHGVPYVVKDIIDVAGLPTKAGSATRPAPRAASEDATVVARLRAAGAVVAAKSQTVEFAFGGWGTNASQGTPVNPWRPDVPHTPGGSSSGTGALVGAGIVPAGLGSDTGGSVRIPASFCGCVGHKTSIGLVSRTGVVPLSDTFDTVGPLTDTVRRAAEMVDAMQGEDRTDESTIGLSRGDPIADLDKGIAGLRLAAVSDDLLGDTDPEIMAHFKAAIAKLEAAGARVSPLALPHTFGAYQARATTLIASDAYAYHADLADDESAPLNATTRMRILMGKPLSARERVLAQRARAADKADFLAVLDRYDALVLPTCPVLPAAHTDVDEDDYRMSLYTRMGNYLDLCGTSVPMGVSPAGLPTGLQILGRHLDDPLALRIAQAYEVIRGSFPTPPAA